MTEQWAESEGGSSTLLDSEPPTNGRKSELESLLREHNDKLFAYVCRYVSSRAEAREIVQEAYCRVFRLGEDKVISHLSAYLYRTAHNLATDWVRQRIVTETFARDHLLRAVSSSPSAEQVCIGRQSLEVVEGAVRLLPPRAKAALLMIKQEGLSYDQVAARLNIQPNSVRRLVQRAMEFLAQTIEEDRTPRRRPR
jgi:RNA polymerase sigma factor (sigma-70 family)